jgi:serine/threonine-protein kinase
MTAEAGGRLCGRVVGGRYRLAGLLARGAAGVVYEADDLEGGEAVAVKLLLSRDDGARQRLLREAEAIAAVAHPCIPRVHGAGTLDGHTPYLVLDRLRGETLGAYLRREGAAEAGRLLALLIRAAEALGVAHEAGIVHRDVKPDNLFLLGPVGAPTDLRVLDFGLSKGTTRLTEPGIAVGTAEYMAPEQVVTDPVDGRTDLYALGVVLFRALSGRLPFEDRDKLRLMARQLLEPSPPLVFALPCPAPLAAPLAGLVAGLLRKDPDSRLPSMNDLASRLRSLLRGGPALDLPPQLRRDYRPRSAFGRQVLGGFRRRLGRSASGRSTDKDGGEG